MVRTAPPISRPKSNPVRRPGRRRGSPTIIRRLLRWTSDWLRFLISITLFFTLIVSASYWVMGRYIRGYELPAPDLKGRSLLQAMEVLKPNRISLLLKDREPHDLVPENDIIRQYPPAGTLIKAGTPIQVVISAGQSLVTLPDLRGRTEFQAASILRQKQLEIGNITREPRPDQPAGRVLECDPPSGAGVPLQSKVNLWVTAGGQETALIMPDVRGRTVEQARQQLLPIILVTETAGTSEGATAGLVYAQSPEPGQPVTRNTRVVITYARGEASSDADLESPAIGDPNAPEPANEPEN